MRSPKEHLGTICSVVLTFIGYKQTDKQVCSKCCTLKTSFQTVSVQVQPVRYQNQPEMEFKEFEPRFKSAKTQFKLSAGLNLETFDTILSETNHI